MKSSWQLTVLAGALVLALGGCVDRQAQREAKATQKFLSNATVLVSVTPIKLTDENETLDVTGSVTTADDTVLGPKQSGKLAEVLVKDGDPVSAGQAVAVLDESTLRDQYSQALAGLTAARSQLSQAIANAAIGPTKSSAAVSAAEAQLRSAKANLSKARAGARPEERVQVEWQVRSAKTAVDTAKSNLDRQQQLFTQGAVSKQQLDNAENGYAQALTAYNAALQSQAIQVNGARPEDLTVAEEAVKAAEEQLRSARAQQRLDVLLDDQVRTAQAGVDTAQAQVSIAKQALDDATIRAPFAGRVSGKPMQAGSIVSPGSQVARVVGLQGSYFEGEVPEDAVPKVKVGSDVAVQVDALPGRTFAGTVAAVSPSGAEVGRLFTARIVFKQLNPEVRPGMFARGTIHMREIRDAAMLPVSAVVKTAEGNAVFVVEGDKAKRVKVELGFQDGDRVQVIGVSKGQQVVTAGQTQLYDGASVQVDKSGSLAAEIDRKTFGG